MHRIKDLIVSGGENVYPAEVEAVLSGMPGVQMVAVIGTPSDKWGEQVTAVIVPKKDHSLGELTLAKVREYCQDKVAGYKHPRMVVIKNELPVSGAGKVLKFKLREEFWKGHEQEGIYNITKDKSTQYS